MDNENPTPIEILEKDLARIESAIQDSIKERRKREFVLLVSCIIAAIYILPKETFDINPQIEIPSISLQVPVKYVAALFPTALAAIYLTYLGTAILQRTLFISYSNVRFQRDTAWGIQADRQQVMANEPLALGLFYPQLIALIPSALHGLAGVPSIFNNKTQGFIIVFVGTVFHVIPYLTVGFVIWRSYQAFASIWLLTWNLFCAIYMLIAFYSVMPDSTLAS
jgi:hypothetical protein